MTSRPADALKRPFVIGVVAVLAMFVALGVVVKIVDTKHRPEGAAERWLDAVSDTTRNGVKADGRSRAARLGPGVNYASLISAHPGGKAAFRDLEVGKAATTGSTARVPFNAHQQGGHLIELTAVLARQPNGTWRVSAVSGRRSGELVPSQGGPAPSKIGLSAWLIAALIGVGLAALCSALVRLAGPPPAPLQA
jgi:hypothetical protein